LRRHSPTNLCDGAQIATFGDFLHPVFQPAECSRFQTCILIRTKAIMCGSMADIQSAAAEIRRGKKEEEEERTNHSMKILWSACLFHRATITNRKSYMSFRLVLKSVILNDLELRNGVILRYSANSGCFRAHCVKVHVRYLIS